MASLTLSDQLKRAGWLPASQEVLHQTLERKLKEINSREPEPLLRVIQNFKDLIEDDPEVYMGFIQMFKEVPESSPIKDYQTLLAVFNNAIHSSPVYHTDITIPNLPVYAALIDVMDTNAGYTTFLNRKVNAQFKDMLDSWGDYLKSQQSVHVLTEDPQTGGWLSPEVIQQYSHFLPGNDFVAAFECDPRLPHWGFTSWDNFFVRAFRPNVRPVEDDKNDNVINSACESTVYNFKQNVKEFDEFWIKGKFYSLRHMLNNDSYAPQFYGGTVYQAFLSTYDYHRWHSPVTGLIERCYIVPGTYYAFPPTLDAPDHPHKSTPSGSPAQSFLSAVATRAVIFIRSDNPAIGLMCVITIGMIEISSCELTIGEGQRINKGDQLGMFHFGGSTHCLVFRPETKFTKTFPDVGTHVAVRSKIAVVTPVNA